MNKGLLADIVWDGQLVGRAVGDGAIGTDTAVLKRGLNTDVSKYSFSLPQNYATHVVAGIERGRSSADERALVSLSQAPLDCVELVSRL